MSRTPFCVLTESGDSVSGNVLEGYKQAEESGSSRQIEDEFLGQYGPLGILEPRYNPLRLASSLELNTHHERACRVKAQDTASQGWAFGQRGDNADESNRDLLSEWMEEMPRPSGTRDDRDFSEALEDAQYDFESVGYGCLELIRVRNDPTREPLALLHIPSWTVRRHRDYTRFVQRRWGRTRWFKAPGHPRDVDYLTGTEHELGSLPEDRRANELVFWFSYSPLDPAYGVPDWITALRAIHGDIERAAYNIGFFRNHGVPAYAVYVTGDFSPGDPDEDGKTPFQKQIEEHFRKLRDKPHSTLVLTIPTPGNQEQERVDVKFEPLSVDTKEASFRMFRKDNRDEVLAAHAVPPYRLGIAETGSLGGSTARESADNYKRSVIDPRQRKIERLVNRHVLRRGFGVRDWRWRLNEIDTSDEAHELEQLTSLFGLGAATPRQVIRHFADRYDLDPEASDHPALDHYYVGGQPVTEERETNLAAVGIPSLLRVQMVTVNEARQMAGLEPIAGGDRFIDPADLEAGGEAANMSQGSDMDGLLRGLRDELLAAAAKHAHGSAAD